MTRGGDAISKSELQTIFTARESEIKIIIIAHLTIGPFDSEHCHCLFISHSFSHIIINSKKGLIVTRIFNSKFHDHHTDGDLFPLNSACYMNFRSKREEFTMIVNVYTVYN